jgi:hypothetical protein
LLTDDPTSITIPEASIPRTSGADYVGALGIGKCPLKTL